MPIDYFVCPMLEQPLKAGGIRFTGINNVRANVVYPLHTIDPKSTGGSVDLRESELPIHLSCTTWSDYSRMAEESSVETTFSLNGETFDSGSLKLWQGISDLFLGSLKESDLRDGEGNPLKAITLVLLPRKKTQIEFRYD